MDKAVFPFIEADNALLPYLDIMLKRRKRAETLKKNIQGSAVHFSDACNGHHYFGLHKTEFEWIVREWAPNAVQLYLIGDFSDWKCREEFRFEPIGSGNWELKVPHYKIRHLHQYKLHVSWIGGCGERIPAYCQRVVQDDRTKNFTAQVWDPIHPYTFKYPSAKRVGHPLIYEAHIGMATEEERIGTYWEFKTHILPRIARLGYNTLQLMAIQEHPYYGSFGYQVSNFYAPSFRFGTPDELKELIDEAHRLGIAVILDIVHSHSVKNELEGIARLDGSDHQYFHSGSRGLHPAWDSLCFDYGRPEVCHFLLSNCKYWMEEYRFDGFRFDGVTSMMYLNHGLNLDFTNYSMYFDGNQDEDAIAYLCLANDLIHQINPSAISVAEDVSGMPGLAVPLSEGGLGFDFRMSMGVADYWIKLLKEFPDEDWQVGHIFYELTNKRSDEHTISYAECHDQAMVGDQTLLFRLLDTEIYTGMTCLNQSLIVNRGIALHKMIIAATLSTAGDGYLNFMGNEFGHPEWIDFPRQGNNWSYKYARRQWSLSENKLLRYANLQTFNQHLIQLCRKSNWFDYQPFVIIQNNSDQVLIFQRGFYVFAFNFHPNQSYCSYGFEIDPGKYKILLQSDDAQYGGFNNLTTGEEHLTQKKNHKHQLFLYLPSRCMMILKKID